MLTWKSIISLFLNLFSLFYYIWFATAKPFQEAACPLLIYSTIKRICSYFTESIFWCSLLIRILFILLHFELVTWDLICTIFITCSKSTSIWVHHWQWTFTSHIRLLVRLIISISFFVWLWDHRPFYFFIFTTTLSIGPSLVNILANQNIIWKRLCPDTLNHRVNSFSISCRIICDGKP